MANNVNTTDTVEKFRQEFNALNGQVTNVEANVAILTTNAAAQQTTINTLTTNLAANATTLNTTAGNLAANATTLNTAVSNLAANATTLNTTASNLSSLTANVAANSATLNAAVANVASINTAISAINTAIGNLNSFTNNLSAGFSDGTVANAGIRFASNNNTGFFKPAIDTIAVTAGGTERARFKPTGEITIGGGAQAANAAANSVTLSVATTHLSGSMVANGSVTFVGTVQAPNASGVANVITNTSATNTITLGSSHSTVKIQTLSTDRITVDASGNVVVGAPTVFAKTSIEGGVSTDSISVGSGNGTGQGVMFNARHNGTSYIARANTSGWAMEGNGNTLTVSLLTGQTVAGGTYSTTTPIITANTSSVTFGKNVATSSLSTTGDATVGGNLNVSGNLTVSGTTTYLNTNTLNIGDNILTLNADYVGSTPTENAGFEVNRGTLPVVSLRWNETTDKWEITNDGTTYYQIMSASSAGSGGGLDADLLDGQHGAYYTNAGNLNAGIVPSARLSGTYSISVTGNANTVTNLTSAQINSALTYTPMDSAKDVGVGTGISKTGTLNGGNLSLSLNTTYTDGRYLQLSTGGTLAGSLETSNTIDQSLIVNDRLYLNAYSKNPVSAYGTGSLATWYNANTRTTSFEARDAFGGGLVTSTLQLTNPASGSGTIWHSQNDGSGSGLDADLLDGQDSSYYTNITARLGWTPVRQGGGPSQDANKTIMMGADNTNVLRVSINGSDYGAYWPMNVTGTATNITAYTINQNLGTSSSPTFGSLTVGGLVASGDTYVYRSGTPTTGVVYLNQSGSRFLYNDGTNYVLPGQELYVNGATALTDNNISQRGISVKQTLTINKPNSTYGNYIYGTTNGVSRWAIAMGEWSAGGESGGNVGSDFTVSRYSDAGNWLGFIIESKRNSGDTYYGGGGGGQHIFNARLYDGARALARDYINGGIFELEKPAASTLSGNIAIDQYGDQFRIFERGGAYRGAYIDIAKCPNVGGVEIWHSNSCYISPWQTITAGGGYTLAHGLGRTPKIIVIEYECVNAEYGFLAGHNIMAPVGHAEYGVGSGPQPQVYDNTYINFRMGNYGVRILGAGTGAIEQATAANWKWRCYAWG